MRSIVSRGSSLSQTVNGALRIPVCFEHCRLEQRIDRRVAEPLESPTRLDEFSTAADPLLPRDAGAIPWRLSVTGSGDVTADLEAIAAFNERHRVCFDECGATVDGYEVKVNGVQDIMTETMRRA